MPKEQRISARVRLAVRALAGVALAISLAFVGAVSADGAPPDNDNWASAITIAGPSDSTTGTNLEATVEAGEPVNLAGAGVTTSQTVWWTWVAPSSGEFTFDTTGSDSFTTLAVFTGSALDSLTPVQSDADAANGLETRVFFSAVADTTYYLQVGTDPSGVPGAIKLTWAPNVVANDAFANATPLVSDGGAIRGWNVGATTEPGEPAPFCCLGHSVWYTWTPTVDGRADFALEVDFAIAEVTVYTGTGLASLQPVQSTSASQQFPGLLSVDAQGGTTYYIQIGTGDSNPGTFLLAWLLTASPGNDDLANATGLGGESFTTDGTTVAATIEDSEPTSVTIGTDTREGSQSVWYRWSPQVSGNAAVSVVAPVEMDISHAPLVQLYQGPALNPTFDSLQLVGTHDPTVDDSSETVRGFVDGGDTYYIQVMSDFTSEQDPDFAFTLTAIRNDLFADATALVGNNGTIGGSTLGGAVEPLEPDPTGGDIANTVWYAWTPTANGAASFSYEAESSGSLAVYTGDGLDTLVVVGRPDYDSNSLAVSFEASAGTTYYIQLGTYFDVPGNFDLSWSLAARPPNDALADAIDVTGLSGSIDGNTRNATTEQIEPTQVDVGGQFLRTGNHSVWYRWTAVTSGEIEFTVAAHPEVDILHEPLIQLYQGPAVAPTYGSLDPVGTHDGFATVRYLADGGETYYVQVMSDLISEPNPDFDFTLDWTSPREISGQVLAANGLGAPGVRVRACLGAVCEETTSNSDGFYGFSDRAPGTYVVRALPDDPALLAVEADADVTLQSAQGVDLRLAISGASSSDAGPSAFRVNGCVGGSLHYVATGDGAVLGSGDVADGAGNTPIDGVYTIDVSALNVGHPSLLRLDITIACGTAPTETQTALLFTDPSGSVVDDAAGGAALAGATVTLLDSNGNAIPAGDPRLSPATSANPETSDARGAWGWDVAPGTYLVRAQKANCGTTTSGPLVVTPANPVTNVVLHLSCSTPPVEPPGTPAPESPPVTPPPGFPPVTPPPPTTLPDPVAGVSFNVVPVSGTVLVNGVVLPAGQQIPFGATIDTKKGTVSITTIGPSGKVQTAYFFGGVFQLLLAPDGVTNLALRGGDFSVCAATKVKKTKVKGTIKRYVQASSATGKTNPKTVVRALWGSGKGSFRTTGRFASATVRGTIWYVADRCDGTYTKVTEGSVTVLDFPRKKVLIVRVGHSVLVRPK